MRAQGRVAPAGPMPWAVRALACLASLAMLAALAGCTPANPHGPGPQELAQSLELPPGSGPFPALVLLHGCGGIQQVHHDWASQLHRWGYATLLVDSFGPRGVKEKCRDGVHGPGNAQDRLGDAFAALAWLRTQPSVDPQRIGVMGWSMGAGVTLRALSEAGAQAAGVAPDARFRAAVALYPFCRRIPGYYAPLLILIGAADDWTPAPRCRFYAAGHPAGAGRVQLIVYPSATHAFDSRQPKRYVLGHKLIYDPDATADAVDRVREFLAQQLAQP
jgi:dienelactone hydrolase